MINITICININLELNHNQVKKKKNLRNKIPFGSSFGPSFDVAWYELIFHWDGKETPHAENDLFLLILHRKIPHYLVQQILAVLSLFTVNCLYLAHVWVTYESFFMKPVFCFFSTQETSKLPLICASYCIKHATWNLC